MAEARRLKVSDLKRRMDSGENFTFLDVRNPQAWSESNVMLPGAIRVPLNSFEEKLSEIPKDKPIVAYCT